MMADQKPAKDEERMYSEHCRLRLGRPSPSASWSPRVVLAVSGSALTTRSTTMSMAWRLFCRADVFVELADCAVDTHSDEAGLARVFEDPGCTRLAVGHDGRQDHHPPPGRHGKDRIDDLLHGLTLD